MALYYSTLRIICRTLVIFVILGTIIFFWPPKLILQDKETSNEIHENHDVNMNSIQGTQRIYIFVAADDNFEQQNYLQIESIRCYAARHGYIFLIANLDQSVSCNHHKDFFYKRHCALAAIMENLLEDSIIFLFDSDVVVALLDVPLDHWIVQKHDIAFYEREFSGEITAGSYQVRNNKDARDFLKNWAELEFTKPDGFHSSDNGAIHVALLKTFDLGDDCIRSFYELDDDVQHLNSFFRVIYCARIALGMGSFEDGEGLGMPKFRNDNTQFRKEGINWISENLSVRIHPRNHAWMRDWAPGLPVVLRKEAIKNNRKTISATPIFFHGVKKQYVLFDYWEIKNMTQDMNEATSKYSLYPRCENKQIKLFAGVA